jgi:DnaJ-class molecular chaperone
VRALVHASAALDARPQYANAAMVVAECLMELLDFDAAATAYRRVAALEPANPSWIECAERASRLAAATAYDILGIADDASGAEVKRAYHSACLQWHPDKHRGSAEAERRAHTMFQRVTDAYETLSDELRRHELDIRVRAETLRGFAMDGGANGGAVFGRFDADFDDGFNEEFDDGYSMPAEEARSTGTRYAPGSEFGHFGWRWADHGAAAMG